MPFEQGSFVLDLTGVVATTGGAIGSVLNPEGVAVIVTKLVLYVVTPSTGSANINVGIGAAATTDASDQISALAINGSITGKAYNGLNPAAKAEHTVWGATQYLNATGDASSADFVGKLLVEYMRPV